MIEIPKLQQKFNNDKINIQLSLTWIYNVNIKQNSKWMMPKRANPNVFFTNSIVLKGKKLIVNKSAHNINDK